MWCRLVLFSSSALIFCSYDFLFLCETATFLCVTTVFPWHEIPGEERVGQPRHAQLFRAAFHQLHAQSLAGHSVEGGDADGRPRNGAILVGQRSSGRHDAHHGWQVTCDVA